MERIGELLEEGLRNNDVSQFLYLNENKELVLKRAVFLILGVKKA